jgi:hypothetical protein
MSLAHLVWISTLVLGALSCAGASPLLPSQDDPNFFSVRMSATGGHKLFPEGPITVEPNSINQQ